MKIKYVVVLLLMAATLYSNAQKAYGEFSATDQRNFKTILEAANYLRSAKTPKTDSSAKRPDLQPLYDTFINKYFDISYLRDSIKDKKNPFEAQKALQKSILYNIDHFLDIIPADSIFVTPMRNTQLADKPSQLRNDPLVVFFMLAGKPFYTTHIFFNKEGKLFGVSPFLYFERKEGTEYDLEGFYRRQKGFEEIKKYLWQPGL